MLDLQDPYHDCGMQYSENNDLLKFVSGKNQAMPQAKAVASQIRLRIGGMI